MTSPPARSCLDTDMTSPRLLPRLGHVLDRSRPRPQASALTHPYSVDREQILVSTRLYDSSRLYLSMGHSRVYPWLMF